MSKKQFLIKILFQIFLLLVVGSCKGPGGVREIKLAHALDTSHPVHEALVFLSEKVKEKSGGEMSVQIYPNQQLGSERELMELLQIGSVGMTKVSTSIVESFAPKFQVFSLPYIFRNDGHRRNVLMGSIGKSLLKEGEPFWFKGLCFYDAGKRSFYTKDRPVKQPNDLAGMKIRIAESPTAVKMVQSFGGSPTPVSWGELYTALQQGIVDGAENNPPSFVTSRHFEACKFYSLNEHTAIPDMVVVSTKLWDRLSEQEKKWLQEAADESAVFEYKLWAASVEKSMKILKEAGVTITYPDQEAFKKSVEKIYLFYQENEPEFYRLIEAIRNHE
jgi:tripartite ATP-independent transporter DctP family solute receptor